MASLSEHPLISESIRSEKGSWRFNRKALATLALLLAIFVVNPTLAQTTPLQIQVSVLPPYSAYLQDYPGTGQQVRVFIINTSAQTYQVRLAGQLTGDNGVAVRTSANYRPPRPVTVPPGQTLLSRTDLEGLFDLNQIDVTGIDKNLLARGFPLPDGTYQLCVRAYNETAARTNGLVYGQPLSAEFPLGCSAPIVVRSVEPPILIAPLCDAEVTATTPQAVVFTWTPPAGVSPAQVDYTLRIVELPQVNVDPNVFIDAVALPKSGVEVRNLRSSTFLYGPTQPPLQLGKRYAWRVQAIDRSRKLNFLNDGKAPVCSFTYGTVPKSLSKPGIELAQTPIRVVPTTADSTVTPPVGATAVAMKMQTLSSSVVQVNCASSTLTAGPNNPLVISWNSAPEFLANIAEALKLPTDSASVRDAFQKIPGAAYHLTITDALTQKIVFDGNTVKEFVTLNPAATNFPLAFGRQYKYGVKAVIPAAMQAKLKLASPEVLTSKTCSFVLVKAQKANTDVFLVNGVLRYQFEGQSGDYPAANTAIKLTFKAGNKPYFTTTTNDGSFAVAVPVADVDALVGTAVNLDQSSRVETVGPDGKVTSQTATAVTAKRLNYDLTLTSNYFQNPSSLSISYNAGDTSASAGIVLVKAYGYRLKVLVQKEFNPKYVVTQQVKDGISQTMYDKKVQYSIDPTLKEPLSGITMYLYRKNKPVDIPVYEGQIGLTKLNNLAEGQTLVAQGVTSLENGPNGPQAVVIFERLLFQPPASTGNESYYYYLTAKPDPDKGIVPGKKELVTTFDANNKARKVSDYLPLDPKALNATFAAPEDVVSFSYTPLPPYNKTYVERTVTYGLGSIIPPKSRLAGRLMYRWPNSNQKFVLANAPFSIRVGYDLNGESLSPKLTDKKTGNHYEATITMVANTKTIAKDGTEIPFEMGDDGFVAVTGVTDANGYFAVDAVNLNQKGQFTVTGTKTTMTFGFEEPQTKPAGGITAIEKLKNIWQSQADTWQSQGMKEIYTALINKGDILAIDGLANYRVDNGTQAAINSNATQQQAAYQTVGTPSQLLKILGTQQPSTGGGIRATPLLNSNQLKLNSQDGQSGAKQQKQSGGGPSPDDDVPAESPNDFVPADSPDAPGRLAEPFSATVDRYFYVEVGAPFYGRPVAQNQGSARILVQPFVDADLGECLAEVAQWNGEVKVTKTVGKATAGVAGARVVIFRDGTKKYPFLPELEGDGQQRVELLPINSEKFDPYGQPFPNKDNVQWFGEGRTDKDGTLSAFTYKPTRLVGPEFYSYYVFPDENSTETFQADIQNGNPSFDVRKMGSRILARLQDDTKAANGLAGKIMLYKVVGGKEVDLKATYSTTGPDGYIEIDVAPYYDAVKTPIAFLLKGYVPGYISAPTGGSVQQLEPLSSDGQQKTPKLSFVPGTRVTGRVVQRQVIKNPYGQYAEVKKGIPAYVRRMADDAVFETDEEGNFTVSLASTWTSNGNYSASTGVKDQQLIVEPRDPGYFADTLKLSGLVVGQTKPLNDVPVYRRLHRIQIMTTNDALEGTPVTVTINGKDRPGAVGITPAEFEFENVSVNNYTVQIRGSKNSSIIPLLFEIKNDETKGYVTYTVPLKTGATVSGVVTLGDGKTKTPLAGARVYLDYAMSTTDVPPPVSSSGNVGKAEANVGETLIETISNADGTYTLRGLPYQTGGGIPRVTLRATYNPANESGPPRTVVGRTIKVPLDKDASGNYGKKNINFDLFEEWGLIESAFGFPLTVEERTQDAKGNLVVTGLLDLKGGQTGFELMPGADVARIRNVTFKYVDVKGVGKKVAIPVDTALDLEGVTNIKFRYLQKYNIRVTHSKAGGSGDAPKALQLTAGDDGRGRLDGKAQIVDNSFNYPSTYLSFNNDEAENFYLAAVAPTIVPLSGSQSYQKEGGALIKPVDGVVQTTALSNTINVLTASYTDQTFKPTAPGTPAPAPLPAVTYNLTDRTGHGIDLKVVGFPATARPQGSYLDPSDKRIHLNVGLKCHIDNAKPEDFVVDIDDLVLDDNQVYPKQGSKPLELSFGAWKLQVDNWKIDPKEGGIVAIDDPEQVIIPPAKKQTITLRTGKFDLPFGQFVLRPDLFRLTGPRFGNLNMGDLATLKVLNPDPKAAFFAYDVGFSGKGYWKIAILGQPDKPAAELTLDKLKKPEDKTLITMPGAASNQPAKLRFDYIQLLSDGGQILTLSKDQVFTIRGNPLARFTPDGFTSGDGFLQLAGGFTIKDAPRTPASSMTVDFSTSKAGSYALGNGDWSFEGKGHTKFTATAGSNPSITANDIVIKGTVEEAGASPKLAAIFCARNSEKAFPYWIQLQKQDKIELGTGGFLVDIASTVGTKADTKDWQTPLTFVGQVYDKSKIGMMKKRPDQPYLAFTVFGDMHVSELDGDQVKVADVTPYGGDLALDKNGDFALTDVQLPAGGLGSVNNKGIKVEELKTPLGKAKFSFDFATATLRGSIDVGSITNKQELGAFKVWGQASMLFDPQGFFIVGSFGAESDYVPPPIQGLSVGVAIGNHSYDESAKAVLRGTSKDPTIDCKIKDGVDGFFMGGGATLFHKEIGFDAIVAEVWASADVSLFASSRLDFGNETKLAFSAGAVATGELGARILCASATAQVRVFGDMMGGISYVNNKFGLGLKATVASEFTAKVDACGLLDGVNITKTLGLSCSARLGSCKTDKVFDFDFVNSDNKASSECGKLCEVCK